MSDVAQRDVEDAVPYKKAKTVTVRAAEGVGPYSLLIAIQKSFTQRRRYRYGFL